MPSLNFVDTYTKTARLMRIYYRIYQSLIISVLFLFFSNELIATVNDTLNTPLVHLTEQTKLENSITAKVSAIQKIVPHLVGMQRQIVEISPIIENYHKVEKLWGFYEEAKRDGTNLTNNPLIHELAFSAQYTLYLLNESLDKILLRLTNEHLRVALVKWKSQKVVDSAQIYQQDKKDLTRLEAMKPSLMENPTITNTAKLANLLYQRDSLYASSNRGKILGEFRKNQGKKIEEVELFYTCDSKKRLSENAPENIMDFSSDKAIQIIRLDREIYQFRQVALASLPHKEQQYFTLKKELAVAASKEQLDTKRKFLKKKIDPTSHHSLILKDYHKLVDNFSFEEQNMLREKEGIFNHPVISVIEFWGCRAYFPGFYEK